jgi:hypothetical protein
MQSPVPISADHNPHSLRLPSPLAQHNRSAFSCVVFASIGANQYGRAEQPRGAQRNLRLGGQASSFLSAIASCVRKLARKVSNPTPPRHHLTYSCCIAFASTGGDSQSVTLRRVRRRSNGSASARLRPAIIARGLYFRFRIIKIGGYLNCRVYAARWEGISEHVSAVCGDK